MPGKPPTISEAESRVMDVLWQQSPQTSEEIVAGLLEPTGWHEKTIKTLLNRLLGKGAISAQKDGRRYLYTPLLRREGSSLMPLVLRASLFPQRRMRIGTLSRLSC